MSDTDCLGRSLLPMRRGQSANLMASQSFQKQLGDSVGEPFGSLEAEGMTDASRQYYWDICSRGAGEYCLAVSYDLVLWIDERDIIFREPCKVGVRKLIRRLADVLGRHSESGPVHR